MQLRVGSGRRICLIHPAAFFLLSRFSLISVVKNNLPFSSVHRSFYLVHVRTTQSTCDFFLLLQKCITLCKLLERWQCFCGNTDEGYYKFRFWPGLIILALVMHPALGPTSSSKITNESLYLLVDLEQCKVKCFTTLKILRHHKHELFIACQQLDNVFYVLGFFCKKQGLPKFSKHVVLSEGPCISAGYMLYLI